MDLTFWVWAATAVVLLVGEVLSPGFYMLPFGAGATTAAIASAAHADPIWQWAAFVGVSSVLMIVLQRVTARRRGR